MGPKTPAEITGRRKPQDQAARATLRHPDGPILSPSGNTRSRDLTASVFGPLSSDARKARNPPNRAKSHGSRRRRGRGPLSGFLRLRRGVRLRRLRFLSTALRPIPEVVGDRERPRHDLGLHLVGQAQVAAGMADAENTFRPGVTEHRLEPAQHRAGAVAEPIQEPDVDENQTTQPGKPLRRIPRTLTIALKRPMVAALPRSR